MALMIPRSSLVFRHAIPECNFRKFVTNCPKLGSNKYRLTPKSAVKMIKDLNPQERALLMQALKQKEDTNIAILDETTPPPSWDDLNKLAIHQSLPFIGFGFLDNLIMIVAGEYIDASIGASLAISTMAAAALGNTISDMFGVGSAWYVEHWAAKLGINPPNLTLEQLELPMSRIAANGGRAIGVAFGCIIGMFPLLFYTGEEEKETKVVLEKDQSTE